jgi:hypothetical protein
VPAIRSESSNWEIEGSRRFQARTGRGVQSRFILRSGKGTMWESDPAFSGASVVSNWVRKNRGWLVTRVTSRSLAEPDAGAASVLIDELDAGRFKGSANRGIIRRGRGRLLFRLFGPPNSGQSEPSFSGQILSAPANWRKKLIVN